MKTALLQVLTENHPSSSRTLKRSQDGASRLPGELIRKIEEMAISLPVQHRVYAGVLREPEIRLSPESHTQFLPLEKLLAK